MKICSSAPFRALEHSQPIARLILVWALLAGWLASSMQAQTPAPSSTASAKESTEASAMDWMVPVGRTPLTPRAVLTPLLELFDGVVLGDLSSEPPGIPTAVVDALQGDTSQRWLFLSLDDGASTATVLRETAPSLLEAARNMAQRVHEVRRSGASFTGYKLDVGVRLFPRPDQPRGGQATMDRSLFGLGLAESTPTARFTFLPEELVARTLINTRGALRLQNFWKVHAWSDTEEAELREILAQPHRDLFHLDVHSAYSNGQEIWHLYRGHRRFDRQGDLGPEALLKAARSGGDYLRRSVQQDGSYVYAYLPKTQEEKPKYNILRHAGTTYSLLEMYQATDDRAYLEAAERALVYLRRQIDDCAIDPSLACVVEDGEVKLGGNGLAMLAFEKHMEVTGQRDDLPLLERLGGYLLAEQTASGEFAVHKRAHPSGEPSTFVSQYYPGEALLALVRHPDGKDTWQDAAAQGARWLILERDGNVPTAHLAHDHWLLYALREIHTARPDDLFLDHAGRIVQAIVQGQNRNPAYPDWFGSFYIPPRSTPTATRAEGLSAAYPMLLEAGRTEEAEAAMKALQAAVRFQLGTQFDEVTSLYVPDRPRVLGGFRRSLDNYEIRIDYVQHNISALLALRQLQLPDP